MKLVCNGILKNRLIFILALILSLVLTALFHHVNRLKNELNMQQNTTQTLMPKVNKSEQILKRIENNDPNLSVMNEEVINLMARLVNKNEVSPLIEKIHQLGVMQNVEIQSLILKEEVANSFYSELPMYLELVGDYDALLRFLNSLQGVEGLIDFRQVVMEACNDAMTNHVKLSLEARLLLSQDNVETTASGVPLHTHSTYQVMASDLRNPFEARTRHVIAVKDAQLDIPMPERKNQIFYKGKRWSVWID